MEFALSIQAEAEVIKAEPVVETETEETEE